MTRHIDLLCEMLTSLLIMGIYVDGRNVQIRLANRVDRASHMGRFFVFPIPAVAFKVRKPSDSVCYTPSSVPYRI
jgi:hypothetical protein